VVQQETRDVAAYFTSKLKGTHITGNSLFILNA